MSVCRRTAVLAFAMLVVLTRAAFAADTGSVSGAVFDQTGKPVAGVTVKISGDRLPAGRTAQTDTNGAYKFEYLPTGSYTVEFDKTGVGTSKRAAIVDLDKETQIDVVLGMAVKEELTVTAATPVVDTKSTEVSFNYKSDVIERLPLERTYRGLFQLIPGVPENRSTVGPAAGGDRQDNTYLIDGANITNPGFGYLSTEINELDIAEINLKRAGISAEFGRTSGTVTNAVSRSGSNKLSGVGRVDFLPQDLVQGYKLPSNLAALGLTPGAFRDPLLTTEISPAGGVGGPIMKDHLFFYGSARYFRETKWNRTNKIALTLPDEVRDGRELYGKLTGAPNQRNQLNVSFRYRPNHVDNAQLNSTTAPTIATTTDNGSKVASLQWAYFMTSRSSLDLRYLYLKENNEDVPVDELGYLPPFNPNNLAAMGQYTDQNQANLTVGGNQFTNIQDYRRHEVHGTFTEFFDVGNTNHTLKAGAGYEFGEENLNRIANGWGTIVNITQNGVPALRTRYYTNQPSQLGQGRTLSLFLQDDITIANRTTINAGILADRDVFGQNVAGSNGCPTNILLKGGAAIYETSGDTCNFLRFGLGDELQPRLGVTYQVRENKGDKAYANWGRYYGMDQKSSARSLAPSRIFQTQTIFDMSGNILSTGPLASTTGKQIDPAIKPIYTDEFLVGYATPFANHLSAEVFFLYRKMNNFIEDVPSILPDTGPYRASNLPCTLTPACQGADAKRTYRAVTFELKRQLADKWSATVSYTWSRFEGNFDLDYSTVSVFNTSSFIQDGPGTQVQDPNRFGPLNEDRPNVFKLFGTYAPFTNFTASAYLRSQSGAPWNARARDWEGAVLNYLEPAGAHRNPVWTNLDLMASYRVPLTPKAGLTVEARLLNVFNNQTQLSVDPEEFLDLRTISGPPYFAPYLQPNPFFSTGNGFAPPRRVYLAASVNF
jgi:Carboxypeptidase regulatory-like domain